MKIQGAWKVGWLAAIVIVCVFFTFPIFWIILTSLKPARDVFYVHASKDFTLSNFPGALFAPQFIRAMINAGIMATLASICSLLITLQSGYLLGRFRGLFRDGWFGFIYIMRTIPYITWGLPLYFINQKLRINDTYWGLLFPHMAVHVAFFSLIMKGFFENIPLETEEAARLDGCSNWGVFLKIAIPQVVPGIIALSIICWLWTWNEFFFALILTGHRTPMLTVAIVQFAHETGIEWNLMSASAVMAIIPAVLICLFAQKYVTTGLRV